MHPCPCCGYQTLPGRGDYDLCPVCWWEDDGGEPWAYSGPNGGTLVEAQHQFMTDERPYRRRPGKVREPRSEEARDPDWRPYERTADLMGRVHRTHEEQQRHWDEERRRTAEMIAADPEGPFKEYNAAMHMLRAQAGGMSHDEVRASVREIGRAHEVNLPEAYLELHARLLKDRDFYRRHPVHAVRWVFRHGRPGTFKHRWREVRTGSFRIVG